MRYFKNSAEIRVVDSPLRASLSGLSFLALMTVVSGFTVAQDFNRIREQLKQPIPTSSPGASIRHFDPHVAAGAADATLRKILPLNADRVLAVGDRGLIILSQDGGRSWTQQPSDTSLNLHSLTAADEQTAWAVGGKVQPQSEMSIGVVLMTRNGGATWQTVAGGGIPRLNGITLSRNGTLIAWGDYSPSFGSSVFESLDGGVTWQGMPTSLGHMQSAAQDPSGKLLAVDRAGRSSILPATVKEIPDQVAEPTRPLRAAAFTAGKWIIVGDRGTAALSSDGRRWSDVVLPLSARARSAFSFRCAAQAGNDIWIGGFPGSVLFRSSDGGQHWQSVTMPGAWAIQSISFADADRGWAVTDAGNVWATRDGGNTWFAQRLIARRLGLLAVSSTVDNVPWMALAETAAEAQQTVALKIFHRQRMEESASMSPESDAAAESAATQIGLVSGETDSAYPVPDKRLRGSATVREYYRTQSLSDRKISASISDDLLVALRAGRPSVVLSDDHSPAGSLGAATLNAVSHAIDSAAESNADVKWLEDELHLGPWKVSKLVVVTDEKSSQFKLSRDQILGLPGLSLSDVLIPTLGLPGSLDDSCSLRVVRSSYPNASTNAAVFASTEKSDDSRRRAELKSIGSLQFVLGKGSREANWRKFAEQTVVTETELAAWLKQLQVLFDSTPPYEQGSALTRCAMRLLRSGQWDRAVAVLQRTAQRAPISDSSRWAAEQLIQLTASDERLAWERMKIRNASNGELSGSTIGQTAANTNASATPPWTATPFDQGPGASPKNGKGSRAVGVVRANAESNGRNLQQPVRPTSTEAGDRAPVITAEGLEQGSPRAADETLPDPMRTAALEQAVAGYMLFSSTMPQVTARYDHLMAHHARRRTQSELLKLPLPDPGILQSISTAEQIVGWKQVADQELILASGHIPALKLKAMCSLTSQPPQLDGSSDDACWQRSQPILLEGASKQESRQPTEARFAFDDEYLYIFVRCPTTRPTGPSKSPRTYDMKLEGTDHVLFNFDTDRDYVSSCELSVNRFGHTADRNCGESSWNPKWYVAIGGGETEWTAEMAVRRRDITCADSLSGRAWAVSVHRFEPDGRTENWSHLRVSTPYLQGAGLLLFEHQ